MTRVTKHARLLPVPEAGSLLGGRLEAVYLTLHGIHRDFLLDYLELRPAEPARLQQRAGECWEVIQGHHVPRRLRFCDVRDFECSGLYQNLTQVPQEHDVRSLRGVLHFAPHLDRGRILFFHGSDEPAKLEFSPRRIIPESRLGELQPVTVERNWSPAPPFEHGLIPEPQKVHQQFGGDPLPLQLDGRMQQRCLFVGSMQMQGKTRPQVGAVLNLGETPNQWPLTSADRWSETGEGDHAMDLETIKAEAHWVIERLQAGERVLVHCLAGMNRSVTICCAVLILLEGLSASAALHRLRQTHPWARPDSFHWLRLRWLAQSPGAALPGVPGNAPSPG